MTLDGMYLERAATGPGGLFYGVYPALVTELADPDQQGRVRISLPWSPDGGTDRYEAWARLATLMAGNNRGTWFVPDVGDEVLVMFEAGNPRRPYVIGALWNGQDTPPENMDATNTLKTILSRQGIRITMEDTPAAARLRLETPGGQSIILSDADSSILVEDTAGNSLKLDAGGISITAAANITIQGGQVTIEAGMVQVNAAMSEFSGVVQCDTLITNAVISSSYTPGAGNIW